MTDEARLLALVAAELSSSASEVADLGATLSAFAEHSQDAQRSAQDTDRLVQTLEALALVLRRLSEGGEPAAALASVTMADLTSRLAGRSNRAAPVQGEVELF